MIILDGSRGEGGGQIVRSALALSTFTGIPFEMNNIRANRSEPGLKAQHLAGIKALIDCSDAKTSYIECGTSNFIFYPGPMKKGKFTVDIGTAGSITLLVQTILLPALFAPGKITFIVKGGTCGLHQPSTTYFEKILLPQLQRFAKIDMRTLKRGYYPSGGGEIELTITPKLHSSSYSTFQTLLEDVERIVRPYALARVSPTLQIPSIIKCYINVSRELEEKDIALRIKQSAQQTLRSLNVPVSFDIEYVTTSCIGGEVVLAAHILTNTDAPIIVGSDILLEKNITSEEIGKRVATKLLHILDTKSLVDEFLCDQILPFACLVPGSELFTSTITSHTTTNKDIIEQFLLPYRSISIHEKSHILSISK